MRSQCNNAYHWNKVLEETKHAKMQLIYLRKDQQYNFCFLNVFHSCKRNHFIEGNKILLQQIHAIKKNYSYDIIVNGISLGEMLQSFYLK